MSKVILKKSSVSGKVPLLSDLEYGELALNYADGIAYYKRSDNTIQNIKSGIGFTASETAPNNPNEGDRWLNTTTGSEFVYLNDGSSTQWVELSLSANSLPAGGTTGQALIKQSGTDYAADWQDITIPAQTLLDSIKTVDGTTSGLDADLLDGYHAATTNTGNTVAVRDSSGIISANGLKLNAAGTLKDIVWNSTEGTFDMSLLNDVTLQLGQEMQFYVKATEDIPDGSLVAFSGAQGDHILASLADLSDPNFKDIYIIGVATQTLTANSFGYITSFGKVHTLNTHQWAEGTILYADPNTVGGLTSTKPQYPNPAISIAAVLRSHSTQGTIFVRPKFNSNLDDLYNVGIVSPTTGDLLVYDSTTTSWKNLPTTDITELGTITAQDITVTGNLIANEPVTILGEGVTSIVHESFSIVTAAVDVNAYKEFSLVNRNSGSDASVDFVAYNNASGAENLGSFFIDMGINSSNFSSTEYPIFPANSGYVFTAGGPDEENPQPSHLYLGTGTPNSDIVLFAGGTALTDVKGVLKADTGNLLLGTINDDGLNKLQIDGGINITGSMNIDGSLYLGGPITLPTQAATKAYVDSAAATGIHIHTPVRVEKHGSWTVTYADGGTQSLITTITNGTTIAVAGQHELVVNDVIYVTSTANGLTANTPYFVYSTPTTSTFTLSQEYMGEQITNLTNGTGLTQTYKANTGVGATLTNAGAQAALVIGGVTLSVGDRVVVIRSADKYQNGVYVVTNTGSASTNWILTRASDNNKYAPHDTNGLSDGDYFYVQEGSPGAGESYVITTDTPILFGISDIVFTLFSSGVAYTVNAPLNLTGTTLALTGVVAETNGGTGQSTVTQGDLLYGSGTNTWSKLSLGPAYKSLVVNGTGTQLEWNAVALNQNAAVSGELRLVNGGTGANLTATAGGVVYSTASALAITTNGTSGQLLTSAGTNAPTWTTSTSANTANAVVQRNASGNFTAGVITATDFNATSDKALKQNVLPAPGLDLLNLVNPVQFDWMASGDRSYGVIAQELEKLLPELVHEDEGIKTVSYIPLIAILIKSVQELSSRVKELESNA